MFKKNSLRTRIFFSMILLVLVAFATIAVVQIMEYRTQSAQYHQERLLDKEKQIRTQISYVLQQTTYPVKTSYIPLIFREDIYHIANIQNVNFDLYDLNGELLKSSRAIIDKNLDTLRIPSFYLQKIASAINKRYVVQKQIEGKGYQNSYSYITDLQFKPIAILNIPYFENDTYNEKVLRGSLYNLSVVYFSLLILAIGLAYLMSKYITKSLKTIEKHIEKTSLLSHNQKIILESPSTEIGQLVDAYNGMIDELEKSKVQLTQSEREQTWKKMAKQVAHEIKNPLTPMRLSVQSYQCKFDPYDPKIREKTDEFCQSIIQQIDILSNISTAFSDLTNMPAKNEECFDVIPIIKRTLDIFETSNISFTHHDEKIYALLDKDQLIRIVTNLVKNAIQATRTCPNPYVEIEVKQTDKKLYINVIDNGIGIADNYKNKIFEPQFTTKTSGSGLGLAIVRSIVTSYGGQITFCSEINKGSRFTVELPKKNYPFY